MLGTYKLYFLMNFIKYTTIKKNDFVTKNLIKVAIKVKNSMA